MKNKVRGGDIMADIYNFESKRVNEMVVTNISNTIVTVQSVANIFLSFESVTPKKLQKLCYYAYAWHYTLYGERLFNSQFEAWIHGPVCPELYYQYKKHGWSKIPVVSNIEMNLLNSNEYQFIKNVYTSYGHLDGDELEYLTHTEQPWLEARGDNPEYVPSNTVINDEVIRNFYSKVLEDEQRV